MPAAVVRTSLQPLVVFQGQSAMAGKITALRTQKRNSDRVSVYLDGRFAFGLPAIVGATLRIGQDLSDAQIEALQEQGAVEGAYDRALDFLSYRPRSRAEILAYLQRRGVEQEQSESVASRLEAAGLLDDNAFAQFWVENRSQFRPRSVRALRYELRRRGIGDEVAKQALSSVDEDETAYRAAGKKARQWETLDQATFSRKLVEYLVRRGFDFEAAKAAAQRHWAELTTDR